jgi:hypothetical protein
MTSINTPWRKLAFTCVHPAIRMNKHDPHLVGKMAAHIVSPSRIFRRGAIGVLGIYFFANGLFKGGLTVLLLFVFLGHNWVRRQVGDTHEETSAAGRIAASEVPTAICAAWSAGVPASTSP